MSNIFGIIMLLKLTAMGCGEAKPIPSRMPKKDSVGKSGVRTLLKEILNQHQQSLRMDGLVIQS